MEKIKYETAVLFSGGIDSLLTAVLLMERFKKVHLITFDKGYLEFGLKNNLANIAKLKQAYGKEAINHEIVKIKHILDKISVKTLRKDYKNYGMEIAWCVACRMSMNIGGLIYALENNLFGFADGSNREQVPGRENLTATAENFPGVVDKMKEFSAQYYVDFLTPSYESGSREERRQKLSELGFAIDFLSLDKGKGIKGMLTKNFFKREQPLCLSGWLIHWKRNLFGIPVRHDENKTVDYVERKLDKVAKTIIEEYFEKKNINLKSLIEQRKAWKDASA
ncbi:MAG: 7-cyano-7-deazaguanine synthase [Candidatus Aminicenantes bacterium]|nr:7-cyano-7-deazaguanine synthase [Candidatus Aminicenantes bacterium]